MNEKVTGRLLILVAAVMWSTSGFFAKSPFFMDWPLQLDGMPVRGPLLAFWRSVFATIVLLPFVRRPRWTPKLIPMVLAYAVMNYTFLNAMTLTTEANAIWLQHTAPVWVSHIALGPDFFDPATADLDGNGAVDVADFGILLAAWGPCPCDDCPADFDGDGRTGVNDFLLLLASWG